MKTPPMLLTLLFLFGGLTRGADTYYANYLDVIDGDTVCAYIYQDPSICTTVRLGAIDAPELDQPYGLEAKQCLLEAINTASEFHVEVVSIDKYDRFVGLITIPGDFDLGYTMVTWGCAWYYDQYAHQYPDAFNQNYRTAENRARLQREGLWQQINPTPPWIWR